jgi:transcriptional regulator with XRE-family HTH domain
MALTSDTLARRIQAAIAAAGMPQNELAARIGIDPSTLSKALSGRRNFKPLEVAIISEALGVPVQELLLNEEEEIGAPAISARAQPDRSPAVGEALTRVDRMLDLDLLLSEVGLPSRPVFRTVNDAELIDGAPYEQGEHLARHLRTSMSLGGDALPSEVGPLATNIEDKLNIDVAIEPLGEGLDGLAIIRGSYRLIMVSSSIPAHRQRYTVAHELGHLMARDGGEVVDEDINFGRTPEETRANAFAAAFLMPASALRTAVSGESAFSEELIGELLARYRVSLDALAFRLHNTGIINAAERDRIRRMSSARISLRHGRAADLQARRGHRRPGGLLDRAIEAYGKGLISIRPIADLLGVHPDTLLVELAPPHLAPADSEPGSESGDGLVPNF